jgi:hypothetical protein
MLVKASHSRGTGGKPYLQYSKFCSCLYETFLCKSGSRNGSQSSRMIGPSIANGYRESSTITGTRKAQETDAPKVHSATNELQNLQSRSIGHVSAIVARVKAGIHSALIVYRAHKAALTFSSGQLTGFANYAVPEQPAGIAGDCADTRFPRPRCQRCGKTRRSTLFHLQRRIYREGARISSSSSSLSWSLSWYFLQVVYGIRALRHSRHSRGHFKYQMIALECSDRSGAIKFQTATVSASESS